MLYVKPEKTNDFEKYFKKAGQFISSISGYQEHQEHQLQKCLEVPNDIVTSNVESKILLPLWTK